MHSTKSTKSTTSTRKKPITEAISLLARRGSNATARVATRAASGLRNMFGIRPATAPVITVEMHDLPVAPAPDRPQSVRRNRDDTPAALPAAAAAAHAAASSRARSVPRDRTNVDAELKRIRIIRAEIETLLNTNKNNPIAKKVIEELNKLSELSQQRVEVTRIIKACNIGIPIYKKERDIRKLKGAKALLLANKNELKKIQSDLGALQRQFYGVSGYDSIERLKRRLQNPQNPGNIKQTAGSTRKRRKHKKK